MLEKEARNAILSSTPCPFLRPSLTYLGSSGTSRQSLWNADYRTYTLSPAHPIEKLPTLASLCDAVGAIL